MIVVDTSILIDALTGPRRSARGMRHAIELGERMILPSLVVYEWLRGPRKPGEIEAQQALFLPDAVVEFTERDAALAARLYESVGRGRGREIDLAIAACAIVQDAALWTLNPGDFADVPGVRLWAER